MITIVLSYYNSGQMLERHLAEWESYAPEVKNHFRAVLVDDGSPQDPAEKHLREVGFPVELYRIKQNLVWNVPGARNLGMDRAPDGWCMLTDIDHLLTTRAAQSLVYASAHFNSGYYYMLDRQWADGRQLHPHPNSFVLEKTLYWAVGGCDEDWTGHWGAGEQVFRKGLQSVARGYGKIGGTVVPGLTHFGRDDIADASTREWGRRDSRYDWRKNPALVEKARRAPYKPQNPLRFEWERVR
jgi:hypothetical protein